VISHLDDSIEKLLRKEMPLTEQECYVGFEIPDNVWETKIKAIEEGKLALNIYLYDVRENRKLRTNERIKQPNTDGTVTERLPPARVDCFYFVTAWKPQATDLNIPQWGVALEEHHLLARVLQTLFRFPELPVDIRQGDLATIEPIPEIPTSVAQPDGMKNLGDFWNAVKNEWRPAIQYVVSLPFDLLEAFTAPMVTTKIMRYGQMGVLYDLKVRPPLPHDHGEGTELRRTTISPSVAKLQAPANVGATNITVVNLAGLNAGDVLMIGSGSSTEFCRLGPLPAAGTTIPIAPPLRYAHEAGVLLHRVVDGGVAGTLSAVAPKNGQALRVGKTTAVQSNVGDVFKIDDPAHPDYVQITTISGPQPALGPAAETLIEIGGQVMAAGAPGATLTGAKVSLVELDLAAISDAEGRFTFSNLSPGSYHLRAEAAGYTPVEKVITVPGALGDYDIALQPNP
jgi:hypothetical protein